MIKWGVRVTDTSGKVGWFSTSKGFDQDVQNAHLYTKIELAYAKRDYYQKAIDTMHWYKKVEVVEFHVEEGNVV